MRERVCVLNASPRLRRRFQSFSRRLGTPIVLETDSVCKYDDFSFVGFDVWQVLRKCRSVGAFYGVRHMPERSAFRSGRVFPCWKASSSNQRQSGTATVRCRASILHFSFVVVEKGSFLQFGTDGFLSSTDRHSQCRERQRICFRPRS